jgi:hypothetical protein
VEPIAAQPLLESPARLETQLDDFSGFPLAAREPALGEIGITRLNQRAEPSDFLSPD